MSRETNKPFFEIIKYESTVYTVHYNNSKLNYLTFFYFEIFRKNVG